MRGAQLEDRITAKLAWAGASPHVSTFHGLAIILLGKNAVIMTEEQAQSLALRALDW